MGSLIAKENKQTRPNVVVIVSDDGGWKDFGFNGAQDIKTPELDTLAKAGRVFHQGYVTGVVCSPSRAGLLTGRHQCRFGHDCNIADLPEEGVPVAQKMISQRFKELGYATAAFGKWHLGIGPGKTPPEKGFDYTYTFLAGSRSYHPIPKDGEDNVQTFRRNGVPEKFEGYITDVISQETAQYIEKSPKNKPFFLYVAYNCPHSPMQAKEGYEDQFSSIENKKRRTLAAMQKSLDEGIGEIVSALKKKGVYDNTLIWFINDNGGATYWCFDNNGMRNHKGSMFEGGMRVAYTVSWPDKIKAGGAYEKLVSSLDIAATSLKAAGLKELPSDIEGVDLVPYLNGEKKESPHQGLFWRHNHPMSAARVGDFKVIFTYHKPQFLFDLSKDPNEKNNLIDNPDYKKQFDEVVAAYKVWNDQNVEPLWRESAYWEYVSEVMHDKNAPWEYKEMKFDGFKGKKTSGRTSREKSEKK